MGVIRRGNSKHWYIQFQHDGRTYIRSSKTTDRKVAEVMEADWRKQLITHGVLNTRERITLQEALTKFLSEKKGLASHQHMTYHARMIAEFFGASMRFHEVRSADIDRWRDCLGQRGYANQTTVHSLNVLRGTVRHAKRLGFETPDLEFPRIKLPKGKLRYLSVDEEKRLLEQLDPKRDVKGLPPYEKRPELTRREMQDIYDLVVLLLDTGARYSEIAQLQWRQVDLKQAMIELWRSKVQNESVLYLTKRSVDILTRRAKLASKSYVFTNKRGDAPRGYSAAGIRKAFRRGALSDCTVHTLRHTNATRLIQSGMNIYEVKEILGHADIRTTMRYAHIERRLTSAKARDMLEAVNT